MFAQKGTKNALGAASGERLRGAGAHSHCPQTPVCGGRPPKGWAVSSGGQNQDRLILLASGALAPSSSQSPLYSGRPSVGIRHVASLRLLSPPNPLRWALAGTPIKYLRCTDTAYSGIAVAAGQWDVCVSALRHIPLSRCSRCPCCKVRAYGPPDHRRTQQVGKQEAVCDRSSGLQILMAAGHSGPRVGECTVKI